MEYVKRKHPRLKEYDYSKSGCYYITVSTENNQPILSEVKQKGGFENAEVILTSIGKTAEQQLLELENRYPYIKIDKYVIMPTHIHAVIFINDSTAGASPRPTLTDIVCAYKSLTTIECNKKDSTSGRKIFQNSFYEKIIRNEKGYREVWQYIDGNPIKWKDDEPYENYKKP